MQRTIYSTLLESLAGRSGFILKARQAGVTTFFRELALEQTRKTILVFKTQVTKNIHRRWFEESSVKCISLSMLNSIDRRSFLIIDELIYCGTTIEDARAAMRRRLDSVDRFLVALDDVSDCPYAICDLYEFHVLCPLCSAEFLVTFEDLELHSLMRCRECLAVYPKAVGFFGGSWKTESSGTGIPMYRLPRYLSPMMTKQSGEAALASMSSRLRARDFFAQADILT